jgi:hypothetical protein
MKPEGKWEARYSDEKKQVPVAKIRRLRRLTKVFANFFHETGN